MGLETRGNRTSAFPAVGELAAGDGPSTAWQRLLAFVRHRPVTADALLGLVLFGLSVPVLLQPDPDVYPDVRGGDALGLVLLAGMTLPLAWRRRRPVAVMATSVVCLVPFLALDYAEAIGSIGTLVALYSVGAHCERRQGLVAASIAFLPFAGILVAGVVYEGEQLPPSVAFGNVLTYVGAYAVGDAFRSRRAYVAELQLRLDTADRLRDEEAASAVAAERARIARELHDVVAHGVSVMVVQAAAARRVMDRRPDAASEALEQIERTGRESMAEMRHLLGVLRDEADALAAGVGDEPAGAGRGATRPGGEPSDTTGEGTTRAPLAPQPGLAGLPELVEGWVDAGLPARLDLDVDRPLPPGPDLAAYRIVQEALTNVAKHAGVVTSVAVAVVDRGEELELSVLDDGRGAASGGGGGFGLMGMRERAALYDGEVVSGPQRDGGWAVHAHLRIPAPEVAGRAGATGRAVP